MINTLLTDTLFAETSVATSLREKPLGFIDIGARGGIHPVVAPLAGVTAILGFEPDKEECDRLNAEQHRSHWAQFVVEPVALSGREGKRPFFVLAHAVNSSLLRPNETMAKRYRIVGFDVIKQLDVHTTTLDRVLFDGRLSQDYWGECLKLDAQGADLDILHGATRTLKERTVAAVIEVCFCSLYENQPMFSEVELFMREHGFTFFGFRGMSYRSGQLRHLLAQRGTRWQERLIHADAVFLKDPMAKPLSLPLRKQHMLFASALLLGYFDFAQEIALGTWATGEEAERVKALVQKFALNSEEAI